MTRLTTFVYRHQRPEMQNCPYLEVTSFAHPNSPHSVLLIMDKICWGDGFLLCIFLKQTCECMWLWAAFKFFIVHLDSLFFYILIKICTNILVSVFCNITLCVKVFVFNCTVKYIERITAQISMIWKMFPSHFNKKCMLDVTILPSTCLECSMFYGLWHRE